MTVQEVAVFIAEVVTYVAVAMLCWRIHPVAALAGLAVLALWWGTFHAPRAMIHLPVTMDLVLRIVWFSIGLVCLAGELQQRLSH